MAATLEQLVKVRSQLAEAVLNYHTQLVNKLDQTDWWRGNERIKASEIAVEPFVFTMRKRERPARSGPDREGREMDVERRSPMDEIEAERYELPVKVEEREEERWRQVIRRGRVRLGLKGAPGSGKTFTTRQTMVALAREAVAQLERQRAGVEEVEIPVWVTAKNLAQTGAREIEEALLEAMENGLQLKMPENLRAWLKREIVSARAFIVVDALDELLESDRAPFEAKAKQLDGLNARVIATCRTMHWEERKDWLGWGSLTEVELAPFKRRQQREFTGRFFERQPDLAQNMERLLQVNFALRHACTTPLLLTFACLLHEEGKVNESTSYAGLYAKMARLTFSGRWRGVKPDWTSSRVREESCWRFFEDIAWRLFSKSPQLNRFTLDDWRRAARQVSESGAVAPLEATVFLEELEWVGIIVPAGFDEQRADLCWSFAHRTFLEFLAARALSRMERQVWLEEAKQHFWFQPEWMEVLTFLAGLVDDGTPLIDAVGEECDDLFGSMLYLKARFVGATRKVDEEILRQVCGEVVTFWRETLSDWRDCLREFALPKLTVLAMNEEARGEKAGVIFIGSVIAMTRDEHSYVCSAAAEALGWIGDRQAVERLLELSRDEDWFVYWAAVSALGQIGESQAVERLLELTRDENSSVRRPAAEALGQIGDRQAVEHLLELLRDEDNLVRSAAAEALGRIDEQQAVERLLEMSRDEDADVRDLAARALGRIGDRQAVERLLELTRDKEGLVDRTAAISLGQIGGRQSVERLLELSQDEFSEMRNAAAIALGQIGDRQAVERLLELLRDEDRLVRSAAVKVLDRIGDRQAVERLLELSREEDFFVRSAATGALGRIGDREVVERLLELTRDEIVRSLAAEALGQIGELQAVERLLELTRDKDGVMREAAAKALWQISRKNKVPVRLSSLSSMN